MEAGGAQHTLANGRRQPIREHQVGHIGYHGARQCRGAKAALDESPHCCRAALQLDVQLPAGAEAARGLVAHAPGQVGELLSVGWWQEEIACPAAQHAQAVDQPAQEIVGAQQFLQVAARDDVDGLQGAQRRGRPGRAYAGLVFAVQHLQDLGGVLHVYQRARAVLGVVAAGLVLLLELQQPRGAQLVQVERRRLVQYLVADSLHLSAKAGVPRDGPQPRERQALHAVGRPARSVVAGEAVDRAGQRPVNAMGPQLEVDLEQAVLLGLDEARQLLDHAGEVLARALLVVQQQQLQV